jgi:hypothetical protein
VLQSRWPIIDDLPTAYFFTTTCQPERVSAHHARFCSKETGLSDDNGMQLSRNATAMVGYSLLLLSRLARRNRPKDRLMFNESSLHPATAREAVVPTVNQIRHIDGAVRPGLDGT